jgi:hypothetical protein
MVMFKIGPRPPIPLPAKSTAPETPVPLSCPNPVTEGHLTQQQWEDLALALHDRWHGTHEPERGVAACARLSGAFDDAAMVAPLIAGWIDAARRQEP